MNREDFETLGKSVIQTVVTYVGGSNLARAVVTGHHPTLSVEVELQLKNDTWEAQSRAIEKMLEVREIYLDEVALDYWFVSEGDCDSRKTAGQFAFAMA